MVSCRKLKVVKDKVYIPKFFRKYKEISIQDINFIYIGCFDVCIRGYSFYKREKKKCVPYMALLSEMKVCYPSVTNLWYHCGNELLCYQRYDEEMFLQLLENGFKGEVYIWHEIYNDNFLERWSELARKGKIEMEKVHLIYERTMI